MSRVFGYLHPPKAAERSGALLGQARVVATGSNCVSYARVKPEDGDCPAECGPFCVTSHSWLQWLRRGAHWLRRAEEADDHDRMGDVGVVPCVAAP